MAWINHTVTGTCRNRHLEKKQKSINWKDPSHNMIIYGRWLDMEIVWNGDVLRQS